MVPEYLLIFALLLHRLIQSTSFYMELFLGIKKHQQILLLLALQLHACVHDLVFDDN